MRLEARRAHAPRTRHGDERGWTLLEIVVATVILLTVVLGFSYGLASSTSLGHATREQGLAREAARAQVEVLRATTFEEVLGRFDADPANDPPGGSSPGPNFDVPGLTARLDDPDGLAGEIVFPLDEDGVLGEQLQLPRLGMPRDLTGEGELDAFDHAGDYRILPVLVRVRWLGMAGEGSFELLTILKRMRP